MGVVDVVDGGTRALTGVPTLPATQVDLVYDSLDLGQVAREMYALMVRNISREGFLFRDSTGLLVSRPGCVIAAPSFPAEAPGTSQDYVFHWVRDAAVTAMEVSMALPPQGGQPVGVLDDFVTFADLCQQNAAPTKGHACFTIDGRPRPWSEQDDGPALQTCALLAAYPTLSPDVQAVAAGLVARNLDFLLDVYRDRTTNLWEEHEGYSFFARSVQLRCFREVAANTYGLRVPDGTTEAAAWLEDALAAHWNGTVYVSVVDEFGPGGLSHLAVPEGYDPNIDIVQAAVYGAVSVRDPRLLSTAAQLLACWTSPASPAVYPVNLTDDAAGRGPLLGRYPGDQYDGGSDSLGNHPWPLCTANFAELCYRLATTIEASGLPPLDDLSAPFFGTLGLSTGCSAEDAVDGLRRAADAMLQAVVYHSDHLALSEQLDGVSGYERSVRDLTWSYAAFLSAVRARSALSLPT